MANHNVHVHFCFEYRGGDDFKKKRANSQVMVANLELRSRRQYKVSVPLKKRSCPTAFQRFKKRNCLPFLRRL